MIPSFSTGGVLTAPPSPLITGGYVPGNTLAAQHLNWFLNHLTLELNNLLTAGGVVQNSGVDTQVASAIANLIAAYHDATKAPLPQAAAGLGQGEFITSALGGVTNLPAGGFWWIIGAWYEANGTGAMTDANLSGPVFASGGATILGAVGGSFGRLSAWRIA
jgi:hypothetical protein